MGIEQTKTAFRPPRPPLALAHIIAVHAIDGNRPGHAVNVDLGPVDEVDTSGRLNRPFGLPKQPTVK